jgi:membrane fusion protein, heavy metal efflux system
MNMGANWNWRRLVVLLAVLVVAVIGAFAGSRIFVPQLKLTEISSQNKASLPRYIPSAAERVSLTIESVSEHLFRAEHITEGKIAVNEDSSTPIFSPYAGRVVKLLVKPSEVVQRGQELFVIEATDTVQALNDFITALSTLNSARSKLNLAQINEKRQNDLYAGKAVPLKDWQSAQNDLVTAQNDMRSA